MRPILVYAVLCMVAAATTMVLFLSSTRRNGTTFEKIKVDFGRPRRNHDVLFYNRIPKTGSLSMEKMMKELSGGDGGNNSDVRFAFHHEKIFKKRHMNKEEQVRGKNMLLRIFVLNK
jgi:hypothetical protein